MLMTCWVSYQVPRSVSGKVTVAEWQYSVDVFSSQGRLTTGRIVSFSSFWCLNCDIMIAELLLWRPELTASTSSARPQLPASSGTTAPSWWSTRSLTRSTGWRRWTPGCLAWTVLSSGQVWAGTRLCWAGRSDILFLAKFLLSVRIYSALQTSKM